MGVDSYLEMYTTVYGWHFYNLTWEILGSTGLLFLPLLAVLINNWREPSESQDDKSAAETSLRRNMIELPILAFVFMIAAFPVVEVNTQQLLFSAELCSKPPQEGNPFTGSFNGLANLDILANTGLTDNKPTLPIFWAIVTRVGAGLNSFLRSKITCPLDLRERYDSLTSVTTRDADLDNQIKRFENECYKGARKIYQEDAKLREKLNQAQLAKFKERLRILGPDRYRQIAINGVQSPQELQQQQLNADAQRQLTDCLKTSFCEIWFTPELYGAKPNATTTPSAPATTSSKTLRAYTGVDSFPRDPQRDVHLPNQASQFGIPTCSEWWNTPNIGIKARLKHLAYPAYYQNFVDDFKRYAGDQAHETHVANMNNEAYKKAFDQHMDNYLIANYLKQGKADARNADTFGTGSTKSERLQSNIIDGLSVLFASLDLGAEAAKYNAMLTITKSVAPMVRSFILMGIYAFLLFYMMVSGYSLFSLIPASLLIISIQIWPSIWQMATVLDDNLFMQMFPDIAIVEHAKTPLVKILFAILTGALFIILPLVLSLMLTLTGGAAGRAMSNALGHAAAGTVGLTGANAITGRNTAKGIKKGVKWVRGDEKSKKNKSD